MLPEEELPEVEPTGHGVWASNASRYPRSLEWIWEPAGWKTKTARPLAAAGTSAAQERQSPPALYCQLAQF